MPRPRPRSKWLCETEKCVHTDRGEPQSYSEFFLQSECSTLRSRAQTFFSVLLSDLYATAEDTQILEYFRNNFMTVEIVKAGILQTIRFRVKNKVRFIFYQMSNL